jgi:hypothetical protein
MRAARIITSSDNTLDHPKSLKPFNGIQKKISWTNEI